MPNSPRSALLDLLDHIPKESPSNPGASLMVNHGYALPSASPPQSATPEFEAEARRIAVELERLHQDGAIRKKSAEDPDASFYANLLRDFGAIYIGRNVPPSADEDKSSALRSAQHVHVPRGLSRQQEQEFLARDSKGR
jgi:hypothetical protein